MFCARCGKEIDNDSTFCLFCGQKVDAPVESGGGIPKPKTGSAKKSGRKVIGSIAAVAVVVLMISGISRLIGGISNRAKSLPEKLFAMSWEEFSELSENDFKDMLDEAGTLYSVESAEDSALGMKSIKTKTTDSFIGGDCLYQHASDSYLTLYEVRYESEEDFKAGREQIEEILEKSLLKNTVAFENISDGLKMDLYPVGVSDINLDVNLDTTAGLLTSYGIDVDELDDEELAELGQYYIYKFVGVMFGSRSDMSEITDEFVFPSDKSYTNNMSVITTIYIPMSEERLISLLATVGGHDAISGKKIDPDRFKDSVDEKLVAMYLDEKTTSDDLERRRELREELYVRLYMMEEHKFDTYENIYLKTDDEKRLWYICNFNWDTDTGAQIDLSDYRDSGSIYCAVECNYNSDTAEYFESELDRALYLADKDYKADTGERFENKEEKRLWFMENYCYDTEAGKEIDKEVVDALNAYQKYVDDLSNDIGSEIAYSMIYLNEDNIPECLVWSKPFKSYDNTVIYGYMELRVLSYIEKNIQKIEFIGYSGDETYFEYTPRKGRFFVGEELGLRGAVQYSLVELNSSDFNKIGEAWYDSGNAGEFHYYSVNGSDVSEDEFDEWFDSFDFDLSVEDRYYSILVAYDNLGLIKYETQEFCIYEYELKDGILTVKADDGANANFGTCQPFEFSYPIADDCVWQEGGHGYGDEAMDGAWDVSPEDIEKEICQERKIYDSAPDEIQSPPGIQFRIMDDEVVAVYTSKS